MATTSMNFTGKPGQIRSLKVALLNSAERDGGHVLAADVVGAEGTRFQTQTSLHLLSTHLLSNSRPPSGIFLTERERIVIFHHLQRNRLRATQPIVDDVFMKDIIGVDRKSRRT